jgi:hypothetical protein
LILLFEQRYYKERYDCEHFTCIIRETEVVICLILFLLIRVITKLSNSEQSYKGKVKAHKRGFDIYFTELGAALTTVLPVLFKYCYKYCYSDSRKL